MLCQYFLESGGQWAAVIKNLKTGEEYKFSENSKFDSASLYKLWVMGTTYKFIREGKITEDQCKEDQYIKESIFLEAL